MKPLIPPNRLARWLGKKVYSNRFIYLDRWSFVHSFSGGLVGYGFNRFFPSILNPLLWVFILLVAFEVFEYFTRGILFKKQPETPVDTTWDIIVGMIGFILYWSFIR